MICLRQHNVFWDHQCLMPTARMRALLRITAGIMPKLTPMSAPIQGTLMSAAFSLPSPLTICYQLFQAPATVCAPGSAGGAETLLSHPCDGEQRAAVSPGGTGDPLRLPKLS